MDLFVDEADDVPRRIRRCLSIPFQSCVDHRLCPYIRPGRITSLEVGDSPKATSCWAKIPDHDPISSYRFQCNIL
eukprot:3043788-Amphidinium_carterae.1